MLTAFLYLLAFLAGTAANEWATGRKSKHDYDRGFDMGKLHAHRDLMRKIEAMKAIDEAKARNKQ